MIHAHRSRALLRGLLFAAALQMPGVPDAQTASGPLALEAVARMNTHIWRVPLDLSPDGQWIAHTYGTSDIIQRGGPFSSTGVPGTEGPARLRARLTHATTGKVVELGDAGSSSWGPVWSADGESVAFYSDAGGEAGLWLWQKSKGRAHRVTKAIARPYFGYSVAQWLPDSRRVLCKILPAKMSVADANALLPPLESATRVFPKVSAAEPSVVVLRAPAPAESATRNTQSYINTYFADLALIDVRSGSIMRLAERTPVAWYALSPDGRTVAYTVSSGPKPNEQVSRFDLVVKDLNGGAARVLARDLEFDYGINVSWSPDSTRLAYILTGASAGSAFVVPASGGPARRLGDDSTPGFKESSRVPLWDEQGANVYAAAGDGRAVWRLDAVSGQATSVGGVSRRLVNELVSVRGSNTLWTQNGSAMVRTWNPLSQKSGYFWIDLSSGQSRPVVEESKSYTPLMDVDPKSGTVAYAASDQEHPVDIWLLDPNRRTARRASELNPAISRLELGHSQLVSWKTAAGRTLSGTVLLPPGYRPGRLYPLLVWVYGGDSGSQYLNRFGFWGDMPSFNFHVPATRGYAVLFPDAPVNTGTTAQDIVDAVLPGVQQLIDMKIADPARVAVTGQSYGSFCTLALITHTAQFKAAIISGVVHSDILAGYLSLSPDGSADDVGFYEQGQGNMGGTPWEYPKRYIDNSLVWRFDKIETPLLMANGSVDGATSPRGADGVFVALRRLGKSVEYRLYEDEGHVISRVPNVIDFWQRRLDFLAQHLDTATDGQGRVMFDADRARSRGTAGANN